MGDDTLIDGTVLKAPMLGHILLRITYLTGIQFEALREPLAFTISDECRICKD